MGEGSATGATGGPAAEHVSPEPSPALDELAKAIAKISTSSTQSMSLVQLGFVTPLVNMITSHGCSEATRLYACRAIAHLASKKENVTSIVDAGGPICRNSKRVGVLLLRSSMASLDFVQQLSGGDLEDVGLRDLLVGFQRVFTSRSLLGRVLLSLLGLVLRDLRLEPVLR